MKKLLILSAAAIVAMVSCAKVSPETGEATSKTEDGIELTNNAIGFQAYNYASQTKATSNLKFYSAGAFNVWAFYTNSDLSKTATSLPDGTITYMDELEVSYKSGDGVWATNSTYYWPKTGKLSFFAYYPATTALEAKATMTNPSKGVEIAGYSVDALYSTQQGNITTVTVKENNEVVVTKDLNDLMVATPMFNQMSNNDEDTEYASGVATIFGHKLAKVRFAADMKSTGTVPGVTFKVVLNSISVKDVFNTGDYSNNAWSVPTTQTKVSSGNIYAASYAPEENDTFDATKEGVLNETMTTKGSDYYVLPQTLVDASKILINYTVYALDSSNKVLSKQVYAGVETQLNKIYDGSTNPALISQWSINKIYNYQFTIDTFGDAIKFDPSITNWDTVDSGDITL